MSFRAFSWRYIMRHLPDIPGLSMVDLLRNRLPPHSQERGNHLRAVLLTVSIAIAALASLLVAKARADSAEDRSSIRDIIAQLRAHRILLDQHLSPRERATSLAPDLVDAILRIEGIYDPTRVGAFGPALRMTVRPGTAYMIDVFSERWRRVDEDPNIHYRVKYLAEAWLAPDAQGCDDFRRYRPDDLGMMLDRPTLADCRRLSVRLRDRSATPLSTEVGAVPTDLPIFAAPYPGSRFTPGALKAIVSARLHAMQIRNWLTRPSR